MELKVGMYIKTRDGNISKIKYINKFIYTDKQRYGKHYIEKPSFDITDLIRPGDYVNGEKVQYITKKRQLLTNGGYDILEKYTGISSVVTKEQFESMKYVVEE